MSKQASPTLIGAFVAGGIGLIVAGILIISGGRLLTADKSIYVLYFEGSVKGLNIGSPVNFRGVNIGTVTDIQLVVSEKESEIRIPVIIEIDNTRFRSETGRPKIDDDDSMDKLIEAGLRAQLQLQSLLTGQLDIQIDFFPGTRVALVGDKLKRLNYEEIPTIPTPIEKIGKLLERIPIDKVVDQALATIEGIDSLVNSEDLHASIAGLRQALEDFRQLVAGLDAQVEPVADGMNLTMRDARATLQKAGSALENANGVLEDISGTMKSASSTLAQADTTLQSADNLFRDEQILTALDRALNEISSAAHAIRILAETVNNQPESLLKGRR